jgi:hypothetical protein
MIEETLFKELLFNFGFPIFVVLWFMFRTEKILKENTCALNKISDILHTINKNN